MKQYKVKPLEWDEKGTPFDGIKASVGAEHIGAVGLDENGRWFFMWRVPSKIVSCLCGPQRLKAITLDGAKMEVQELFNQNVVKELECIEQRRSSIVAVCEEVV